jgi:hypothetical protein
MKNKHTKQGANMTSEDRRLIVETLGEMLKNQLPC